MSRRRNDGVSIVQALAMTVAEIPMFLYSTFGQSVFSQLRLSPNLKKVLFATALGSVALALTAHQLKRRRHKRKQITPGKEAQKQQPVPGSLLRTGRPSSLKRAPYPGRRVTSPSSHSNDTLSGISSIAPSKHSSSSHSLASMRVPLSSSQAASPGAPWEAEVVEEEEPGNAEDNADNLYVLGMELFEEALQKWEQALNIRQQSGSNMTSRNSLVPQKPAVEEQPEARNKGFAEKLETLLHRAYNLQEEFGSTIPPDSLLPDFDAHFLRFAESEGTLILPNAEGSDRMQMDGASGTSEDSFFSAAELFDALSFDGEAFPPSKPAGLYEEALMQVREGQVCCRTLRTELLECYSDQDFLSKLQCVRQAFQLLLQDESHRLFFTEIGKQMISGLMIKAGKSPKGFLESYEEMLRYTQRGETWATTQMELEGRGVVCMNFFDIVLDFILMDAFEDLESPPSSVVAVLRNRWLSDSFKETALVTACWSVLKAKRRLLMVPDGFISHFYSISEHVSPVLAFGFLGPKQQLCEVCNIFKQQIVHYLKDMFDHDKVRYTSCQSLADDILRLSRRRSEILLGYLGIDSLSEPNGTLPLGNGPSPHN
ncbi:mitoguardin 2-like isoform X1 [Acipenser ruthenus]|uniref:mitoguardin 2-like isoform X1 n=1 Tax=Acipenser ruthenus TaxID=7906 RepID=UPI0027408C56|nr:mitoguardin 2-like isoform X1 [Acipenser ruthenus]XP_058861235.1 mitoguardin 2-like isoform X1 [Acipenser ruthenus]